MRQKTVLVGLVAVGVFWSTGLRAADPPEWPARVERVDQPVRVERPVRSDPINRAYAVVNRLSCEQLWMGRNEFYSDRGLCLTYPAAIRRFGNEGCRYKRSADLPLSPRERRLMAVWIQVERDKGCLSN